MEIPEDTDPSLSKPFSLHPNKLLFHSESKDREWLKKHGKGHYIDFDENELRELRKYFDSLDEDGSESIGASELEDPLIALGLVESRI